MKKHLFLEILSSDSLYKRFLSPILSKDTGIDPEQLTQSALAFLGQASIYRKMPGISGIFNQLANVLHHTDQRLEQQFFGKTFKNPIGLAAGFDKNGVAAGIWEFFGFGYAEIGTVTWHSQKGNPRPRLFRLAKEQAALNRMGFNNNGAKSMLNTLKKQNLEDPLNRQFVLGINFGKSKITPLEQAFEDYAASLEILSPIANYAVINVSSPNTPGLRELQQPSKLRRLIRHLQSVNNSLPLLIKIAPDLEDTEIQDIASIANEEKLAGLIAVNTSLDRFGLENRIILQTGKSLLEEAGGLSGSPLQKRAVEVIKILKKSSVNDLPLIGVGGIDSPEIAWERITAGASLLQVYTGWIFQGPALVTNILKGFSDQLDRHKFKSISEAIGSNAPWL